MTMPKEDKPIEDIDENNPVVQEYLYKPGESVGTDYSFKREIVWFPNVVAQIILHTLGLYGVYLAFFQIKFATFAYTFFLSQMVSLGVTAGLHRLFAHRSYKAKTPLKVFLLALATLAGQNSVYRWALDHRQHHKYTDTDADPHNSNRGFFFSHAGWLMSRPHPAVKAKRRTIDMTDLDNDPLIMFQRKYFFYLYFLLGFLLSILFPMYFLSETLWTSFFACFLGRYVVTLNFTWTVNSLAHLWGSRPFDKQINPRENYLVAFMTGGEGWHNYHHVFPWDYKTSEHGISIFLNPATYFIDLCARIGWAYDLRTTSDDMIRRKIAKSGDSTYASFKQNREGPTLGNDHLGEMCNSF